MRYSRLKKAIKGVRCYPYTLIIIDGAKYLVFNPRRVSALHFQIIMIRLKAERSLETVNYSFAHQWE